MLYYLQSLSAGTHGKYRLFAWGNNEVVDIRVIDKVSEALSRRHGSARVCEKTEKIDLTGEVLDRIVRRSAEEEAAPELEEDP